MTVLKFDKKTGFLLSYECVICSEYGPWSIGSIANTAHDYGK